MPSFYNNFEVQNLDDFPRIFSARSPSVSLVGCVVPRLFAWHTFDRSLSATSITRSVIVTSQRLSLLFSLPAYGNLVCRSQRHEESGSIAGAMQSSDIFSLLFLSKILQLLFGVCQRQRIQRILLVLFTIDTGDMSRHVPSERVPLVGVHVVRTQRI